jgi:hypothetical protein
MLTSLPPYKHDHPNFVVFCDRTTRQSANRVHSEQVTVEPQDYTSEAWHAAVVLDQPALFKIPGFSPDNMKTALLDFTRTDTHQFCTTGGGHGSQGVRMNVVFNDDNKKNLINTQTEHALRTRPANLDLRRFRHMSSFAY